MVKTRDLGLTPFDELFETSESRLERQKEKVEKIPLDRIDPFPSHPFQVRKDEAMAEMAESIRQFGVLTPAVLRPTENERYEMVSGHRRMCACEMAGLTEIPAIIRDMSRDEAILFMVDSNLQRTTILPSEKGFSYKMRLEAMSRQGKRTDLTSNPSGGKLKGKETAEIIGEEVGESQTQIRRYIRLTNLIPELLNLVDEKLIAMRPAVEISYFTPEAQMWLFEAIQFADATPSHAQTLRMRKFAEQGRLTKDVIDTIMDEEKPNQKEKSPFRDNRISKAIPASVPKEKQCEYVLKAIDYYNRALQKRRERDAR